MRTSLAYALFAGAAFALSATAFFRLTGAQEMPRAQPAPVASVVAELRETERTWDTDGMVEAVKQATVSAQVAGRVLETSADAGDRVERGQLIARIDPRELTEAAAGAQAQVAAARTTLAQAQMTYERTRELRQRNFVSQAALDKAASDRDGAQAQLEAALASGGQARTARGHADVRAPFAGIVANRAVEVGELASAGRPLYTLYGPGAMRIVASVPQHRLPEARSGMRAIVEIPSLGRTFTTAAVTVLPASDVASLTTRVRIDVPEDERNIVPGTYARVRFVIGSARVIAVPARAIFLRGELTGLYVLDDAGRAHLRQVRTGASGADGWVEVLAGLEPGERVALDPTRATLALNN